MATDLIGQHCLLFWRAKLEELLNNIVSKHISHEGVCSCQDLVENHLLFCWGCSFKLLLDEPGRYSVALTNLTDITCFLST